LNPLCTTAEVLQTGRNEERKKKIYELTRLARDSIGAIKEVKESAIDDEV
jgi:hypothetical protein